MFRVKDSLRKKLIMLVIIAIVPLLILDVVMLAVIYRFQSAYDEIITNMTVANSYNLNFKDEFDECIYKLVFNGVAFSKPDEENAHLINSPDRKNPYVLIYELRGDFSTLASITTDTESAKWLSSLLRNIDTLEDRVDDIRENLSEGGRYQENIEMLDKNIYILTELINDDIQYYIYYQTQSIGQLKDRLSFRIISFRRWTMLGLIVLITLVILITVYILKNITTPLEELTRVTRRIAGGDFSARAGIYTEDEIGKVSDAVNDMAEHLEVMVDQIKEDERTMRNAELRLLQEQINPHFLYNTLDAIVWLIEGGRDEEAEDMVMSLSEFFKQVLSHGRETITIREEERHIRSYLQIQQVRYRDILDYTIEIDPSIYQYQILKLTLQPLVENALYHGIKPKRARGLIRIRGRLLEDHTICLTVEDDGVGIPEETLEKLRTQITLPCSDDTEAGFGMANVNERIRLNYGKEYGMTIDSEVGKGTKVTLILPALWMKETVSDRGSWSVYREADQNTEQETETKTGQDTDERQVQ